MTSAIIIGILSVTSIIQFTVMMVMKKKYEEVIDDLIKQVNKQQLWKFRDKPNAQKSKGRRNK